ncbi:DUF4158 domain-containing protein [Nonomuraea polychroma]|uniref:DUF4158 domain-containing protein n=1 Tax=Nonomuraea polychroma TaxID=46176 RepID=UPI003D933D41
MFSEEQLEQLRSFPEISADELLRYFTPTAADVAFVDPGRGRGTADQVGMLVQLCTLPCSGSCPTMWPRRRRRRWPGSASFAATPS